MTARRPPYDDPVEPGEPLHELLERSSDLIFRFRFAPTYGFEYLSASVLRLTGYTREELYGDPDLMLGMIVPDDRPRVESIMSDGRAEDEEMSVVSWRHRDGRLISTEQCSVPILDEDGNVVAVEGIARVVTDRLVIERQLRELDRELGETQALAKLGSWTWDLVTGVVQLSDELERMLGIDVPSSDQTANLLMEHVVPEDRPRVEREISAVLASGGSYTVPMRVLVRGEVRWMIGRGETVPDETGATVRLLGTLVDETERKLAQEELEASNRRFRVTMESAPDAVIGVDRAGLIVFANNRVEDLFGHVRDELIGRSAGVLFSGDVGDVLASGPAGPGRDLMGRREDGSEFPVDVSLSSIDVGAGPETTVFIHDATDRRRAEEVARHLREAGARRRQALEINDRVMQGIAAAVYALESGDAAMAANAVAGALEALRGMVGDLLAEQNETSPLAPGDLVRAVPAALGTELGVSAVTPAGVATMPDPIRIVLADDTYDIRLLLRVSLGSMPEFEIVGEAENGQEAIDVTEQHAPDVILLDLAMPVLDGLQAIPEIRRVSPATKIIVLSGYASAQVEAEALALGAVAYVEKGCPTEELADRIHALCPGHDVPPGRMSDAGEHQPISDHDDLELFLSVFAHEMRSVTTVIGGTAEVLRSRTERVLQGDDQELLESLHRNALHLSALVATLSEAAAPSAGSRLDLQTHECDLVTLVTEAVTDLEHLAEEHEMSVSAVAEPRVTVDQVRIRQVLTNLIGNATKYSATGTRIDVEIGRSGTAATVTVRDEGPGVAPAQVDRIFDRFVRGDVRGDGLGLGLFIARGIARAHGGDLVLQETGADGSSFVLSLPAV
ncbi:PAS domain S-box protein [Actinospongicola halichondriae]|uniref:sensor histidine kinase n=1 Tax=Actinospongicola halichondriae TaxID=3236844 RepID=UPI003D4E118A